MSNTTNSKPERTTGQNIINAMAKGAQDVVESGGAGAFIGGLIGLVGGPIGVAIGAGIGSAIGAAAGGTKATVRVVDAATGGDGNIE